jgi:hypothetical protein
MAKRIVTNTIKNPQGDILYLVNPTEVWSPRSVKRVIDDIEGELHNYVVHAGNHPEASILVVDDRDGKYLRTAPDFSAVNNLDFLDSKPINMPEYIGNYPSNKKSNWSDNLQGVAHSEDHWFFTQKTKILKINVSTDIDNNAPAAAHMPQDLQDIKCNHFGDPDYWVTNGIGYLFIPVEGEGSGDTCNREPRLAVFKDGNELSYVGSSQLSRQHADLGTGRAGWCAINPVDGLLYSSHKQISEQFPIFRYRIDFEALDQGQVVLEEAGDLILKKNGRPMSIPEYLQGGCFSPSGLLFICSGKARGHNENRGGIYVFDQDGSFLYKSSINDLPFKYEYHAGFPRYQEPEGLTYWDLTSLPANLSAPHIQGQIHTILLNNRWGRDKIWFKHYRLDGNL